MRSVTRTSLVYLFPLIIASGIWANDGAKAPESTDEPLPPDILLVKIVAENDREAIIEATLKSSTDGDVELSVSAGAVLTIAGRPPKGTTRLLRNGIEHVNRYHCDLSHGEYRRLTFRAVVKDAEDRIAVTVTKIIELNLNKKVRSSDDSKRLPIVIETADGGKIVEYMTYSAAVSYGFTPAAESAPKAAAKGPTTGIDPGRDSKADERKD